MTPNILVEHSTATTSVVSTMHLNTNLCLARKSKGEPIQCPNKHRPGSRFCGKHHNVALCADGSKRSQKSEQVATILSHLASSHNKNKNKSKDKENTEPGTKFKPVTHLDYFRDPECLKLSTGDITRNYQYYKLGQYRSTAAHPDTRREIICMFIRNLANYMLHIDKLIKLQRLIRQRRYRILSYNRGIAVVSPLIQCNNTEDFFSFDPITEINPRYLFTYRDTDGFHYGFHIHSFMELVNHGGTNPYNRAVIPQHVIDRAKHYLAVLSTWERLDNKRVHNDVKDVKDNILLQLPRLPLRILAKLKLTHVFQKIDFLGYQTDIDWLYGKSTLVLNNFIKALYRTWTFQLGLSDEMKDRILQDHSEFDSITDEAYRGSLLKMNKYRVLTRILDILDEMLNTNLDNDTKNVVAILIIHSLYYIEPRRVFVSNPWLD